MNMDFVSAGSFEFSEGKQGTAPTSDAYVSADFCAAECILSDQCAANRERCLTDIFANMLETLTETEGRVLSLRTGIHGTGPFTLAEVADRLGIMPEQVKQIEAKALRKLRHPSRSKLLKSGVKSDSFTPTADCITEIYQHLAHPDS